MGIPHEVIAEGRRYKVITDTHLLFRVLAWGRVADALTGNAPGRPIVDVADLKNITVRVFEDGFWCVAGNPGRTFEDLSVANTFIVALSIAGYRSETVSVTIPANPVWPIVAGIQPLRPVPVRLQGRVTAKTTGLPVADGKVIAMDPVVGPPPAPRPFPLRSYLKQTHTAAASVQGVALTPVILAPPARMLEQEAVRGAAVIIVNSRIGLAATQIVQFRDSRSGEYARILSVSPVPANLALPGEVTLETAMGRSFPAKTPISLFVAGASIGASQAVMQRADSGNGILLMANYPAGDVIRVSEVGLLDEFHGSGALTDADGYYALDAIGDVSTVHVGVEATGFAYPPNRPEPWVVNYNQAINAMDFRLI